MNSEKENTSWPRRKMWAIVFGITSVIALFLLGGTARFMFNVNETRFVLGDKFSIGVSHNCLTAYAAAAYLASTGADNIYDRLHYGPAPESSTPIHKAVHGIFKVDDFLYPPQFLILPYGLWVLFKDFLLMRTAWFALTISFVITALAGTAWWCGAFRAQPQLLLFPLLLCAPVVYTAIQIGNAHVLIIAISILAMIAFEKRRPFIGGALLGFAMVAKIWPAILLAYLIVQRRWKPVAYCVAAAIIYTLVSILLFGIKPYQDFFTYGLSHVANEVAVLTTGQASVIIDNISIFGIPQKLYALHLLSSHPMFIAPVVSWSFTAILGAIVVAAGLRLEKGTGDDDNSRLLRVQLWLILLTLVQLRSPFLPWHYGTITTLWLLVLSTASPNWWKLGITGVAWICLAVNMPIGFLPMAQNSSIGYTLFAAFLMYGVIMVTLRNYFTSTKWVWS